MRKVLSIIEAPSRKHILKNDIWQYFAADRFMRIIQAPKRNSKLHNEMWTNPFFAEGLGARGPSAPRFTTL
jgi:hypothetical protein